MKYDEPLAIPPGIHRINETILMTDPDWKSVMRAAFRTDDQQLRRNDEAGGEGAAGDALAEDEGTFAAK